MAFGAVAVGRIEVTETCLEGQGERAPGIFRGETLHAFASGPVAEGTADEYIKFFEHTNSEAKKVFLEEVRKQRQELLYTEAPHEAKIVDYLANLLETHDVFPEDTSTL